MNRSDFAKRYVKKRKRSAITEVGIFTAGFGIVLLVLAVAFYLGNNNDKLFGMPRMLVIGSVVGFLGVLCTVPGILLLIMRSKPMIWASVVCASLPAIVALGLLTLVVARTQDFIGLAFLIGVPALLIARGLKATQEVDEQIAKRENSEQTYDSAIP